MRLLLRVMILLSLCISLNAYALDEETNQTVKIKGDDQALPVLSDWRMSVTYDLRTNLAEPTSPRRYDQMLNPEISTQVKDWFRLSAGLEFSYYSVGNNIPNEPDNPSLGDVYAGGIKAIDLGERHSFLVGEYLILPTSNNSRYEGYRGASLSFARLTSFLWPKRLALVNMGKLSYIANTYEFSPTSKESSPEWSSGYSGSLLFLITRSIRVSAGITTQFSRQLNGADKIASGNFQTISYVEDNWMASLTYSNTNFADEYKYDVLVQDPYRQHASLKLAYEY